MEITSKKINFCFQQSEDSSVHKLYIYDDVTKYGNFNWNTWEYDESETSCDYFRKKLEEIPETDTIELHINSNGGLVKEGIAIFNLIKRKKCKQKTGYVDAVAYSVAFLIFQACDLRIMGEGSSALIHNMAMGVYGNSEQLRKAADDLDILMESDRKIFLSRSKNLTEQELINMMNAETYLTPDQCLEYGFCDKVETFEPNTNNSPENITTEVNQSLQQQIKELKQALKHTQILQSIIIPESQTPQQQVNKSVLLEGLKKICK